MIHNLWGFLTGSQAQKEAIDAAKTKSKEIKNILRSISIGSSAAVCQQLQCFRANSPEIFKNFNLIAHINPLDAIESLMSLEKILGTHAQVAFWSKAPQHIVASLSQSSMDTKDNVYKYIFENAHIGQLANFMIEQSSDFERLLKINSHDEKFIERLINHAAPRIIDFLNKFKAQFEGMVLNPATPTSLVIKLCEACRPLNGIEDAPLPDFVEAARSLRIQKQVSRIFKNYFSNTPDYQEITGCLQRMNSLRISETDDVKRLKSKAVPEKSDINKLVSAKRVEADLVYLYLYKIPQPDQDSSNSCEDIPKTLYIIASKKAGYATNSGLLKTILISTDLQKALESFQTLLYSNVAKSEVASLVSKFTESSSSFELTPLADRLNSIYGHTHLAHFAHGDILPLQHHQPSAPQ